MTNEEASAETEVNDDDHAKEKEQAHQLRKEAVERMERKDSVRSLNQSTALDRPDDDFFRKLDSSLKKNTAFVKKLGKLSEQQRTSLSNDFQLLNLSRYIQEVVSTLIEAKLKMTDISCAVHVCSLMHKRYADFTPCLFQAFKRLFVSRTEDKSIYINNMSKVRTDLRFVAELTVSGIFTDKEGLTLIHNQLCNILAVDREQHELLSIIISVCKYNGEDLAGLVSRKNRLLADKYDVQVPKSTLFNAEKQKIFYNVLLDYWNSVKTHLLLMHKDIVAVDHRNRQILQNKGELHEEKSKEFSDKQAAYHKLLFSSNSLADLLDEDSPDLPEGELNTLQEELTINIYDPTSQNPESFGDQSIWEDEDQRSFYTNLLDLKVIIPAILFKPLAGKNSKKSSDHKSNRKANSTDAKPTGPRPSGKSDLAAEELESDLVDLEVGELEETDKLAIEEAALARAASIATGPPDQDETVLDPESDPLALEEEAEEEDINIGASIKTMLDNFIVSLKDCINRDLVDKAAQDFCMNMNTRVNRNKLARALFNVHRSRLDLLPFYARLATTLHSCVPDVAEHLTLMLFRDFRFHVRKKDQIHIESKVKTVRFIGEMTKFGMIPPSDTLNCLKLLILEFSPHTIEMACALLETSGRFMLRSPASHLRARVLVDQLLRKRTAKALDQRYSTMIDNAWYACDPPKIEAVVFKPRPPLHQYIRKLIFRDLSKSTVEKVLRQMRKLPWNSPDINSYIIKCLSQSWNMKFNNVHCLASLVAGLVGYRDDIGHNVVDDVLEEIRVGMEINHPRYNQRRFSNVKFLGELYNYRMLESMVVFNVLYSLITFGVTYDFDRTSVLDPPENLFRIRLVCVLLETCGQYFDRGSSKRKLDYFLSYFQRYMWFKKSHPHWMDTSEEANSEQADATVSKTRFPVEVDYLVQDTIEPLRPKLQLATSLEMAHSYVNDVEREIFLKLTKVLSQEQIHGLGTVPKHLDHNGALSSIPENSEADSGQIESNGFTPEQNPDGNVNSQSDDSDDEGKWEESDEDATDQQTPDAPEEMEVPGDDDSTVVVNKIKHVESTEDDDFKNAFDAILVESIQARKQTQVIQQDMSVPVNVQKTILQEQAIHKDHTIKFALLTKKGNKPTLRPLRIPVSEQLAAGLKDRTEEEEKRKKELKLITLSINERQVEEEQHQLETASYSKTPPANLNRERRPKYQPPKGAPNADLIFSSGGRRR